MRHSCRIKVKDYANTIYHMLQCGLPRRRVKELLYNDHKRHVELGIDSDTLDNIWEAIMEDMFDTKQRVVIKKRMVDDGSIHDEQPEV